MKDFYLWRQVHCEVKGSLLPHLLSSSPEFLPSRSSRNISLSFGIRRSSILRGHDKLKITSVLLFFDQLS
jgi:hypothetical protein